MKLNSFTKMGTTHNEDVFAITSDYGFVLDGATGLYKERITNMQSDAQWFAHEWKNFLQKNLQPHNDLIDIFKHGVEKINNKYMTLCGAENVNSKPSASVALYRIINNKLEYFLLGDCSMVITKTNGEVLHLQQQELLYLDQNNINVMQKLAKEKNINVIETRELVNKHLIKTRLSQNTPEGYYILSDSQNAINKAMHGEISINEIKQVIVLSDGFSQVFDTFNFLTVEKTAELVEASVGLDEIYNILWKLQEHDKGCNNYPRTKLRDDATAIVCKI